MRPHISFCLPFLCSNNLAFSSSLAHHASHPMLYFLSALCRSLLLTVGQMNSSYGQPRWCHHQTYKATPNGSFSSICRSISLEDFQACGGLCYCLLMDARHLSRPALHRSCVSFTRCETDVGPRFILCVLDAGESGRARGRCRRPSLPNKSSAVRCSLCPKGRKKRLKILEKK